MGSFGECKSILHVEELSLIFYTKLPRFHRINLQKKE